MVTTAARTSTNCDRPGARAVNPPALIDIAGMLDLKMSEWALGLAELLTNGHAIIIADDDNRECLILTTTPIYGTA
ncbi:hypothetical protein [Gordonia amicalis]|uniref:hypothetical protein n=1 Tax=Gordonia amicalis TaxID=89053 RepID=UPI0015F71D4A|nr:hypothetical protein [Gordonia amicalis]MBA5846342.1 hypothetical protein [Gordonia amicalis]